MADKSSPNTTAYPSPRIFTLFAIAIAAAGFFLSSVLSPARTQVITTSSGKIRGQIAKGTTAVNEFLGVPFAKPPVGQLRWAPPQALDEPSGDSVLDATKYGHSCPAAISKIPYTSSSDVRLTPHASQVLMGLLRQPQVTYSEDCLTLNIWSKPGSGSANKAVLFWIYGGGFNTGTTHNDGYNGKYFAEHEDVIVVSANYRLNIFGFPGNPHIRNNLALLDQRLAIEWVRDNIAAFGGDPERITLFGESAGGASVDYYSYAFTSDPIVNGFIAQSGTAFSPNTQANTSTSASFWYNVTEKLSCGDKHSDQDELLSCMKSKSWEAVQNAIPSGAGLSGVVGTFGPTVDDLVIFGDYVERSMTGSFIKKPLLIGETDNEPGLFKATFACQNISYPEKKWNEMAKLLFTCATANRALASVVNEVPTWRYRFFAELAGLKITTEPDSGAYHGSDVPIIFGTDQELQNQIKRSVKEEHLVSYLRGAWATFAKDPENGLDRYGLPHYDPSKATLLQLGHMNETGPHEVAPGKFDEGCPIPKVLSDRWQKISK